MVTLLPAQSETQLSEVSKEEFQNRVREAFTFLESAVEAGEIQYYAWPRGTASGKLRARATRCSWGNPRQIAQEIAGGRHHFRFVQLAVQLAMTER